MGVEHDAVEVVVDEGDKTMTHGKTFMNSPFFYGLLLMLFVSGCSHAKKDGALAVYGERFSSPDHALQALKEAVQSQNHAALTKIFGADGARLIDSGDPVEDRLRLEKFSARIQEKNSLEIQPNGQYVLFVGEKEWPFPIPIVKDGGRWVFDTAAGLEEILDRRIGENELRTIRFLQIYIDAQEEYYHKDRDGDRVREYAQILLSTPKKKDGLYWKSVNNKERSPLGPVVAEAAAEGYAVGKGEQSKAYHGYFFKPLSAQGKNAPGGERSYLDRKGNMVGGFALLAYPASWGSSGIMSFIVNQDGDVYQKDFGIQTVSEAHSMKKFDPDSSWEPVQDPEVNAVENQNDSSDD